MEPTVQYVSPPDDDADLDALVDDLLGLYATYGWWADRDRADVRAALPETDELVVLRAEGEAVAAARVLTDYVYYAQVYDVVVHGDHRGEGFGQALLDAIVDHPRLDDVSPSLLAREGLTEFYEAAGFTDPNPIEHPDGEPEPLSWLKFYEDGET